MTALFTYLQQAHLWNRISLAPASKRMLRSRQNTGRLER